MSTIYGINFNNSSHISALCTNNHKSQANTTSTLVVCPVPSLKTVLRDFTHPFAYDKVLHRYLAHQLKRNESLEKYQSEYLNMQL